MAVEETNDINCYSPKTEEEYADRIARLQSESLIPLKEDLSDWLNRILDTNDITADNFMTRLDNGVIVCKLAKLIQDRCDATQQAFNGKLSLALEEEIPINGVNFKGFIRQSSAVTTKCWENAKSQSFYARDNVSNFIKWCRKFGVRDALLFESEDLVSHVNPRNVVLCLLEIARIACTKHSFSPAPGLVQFEQEIDELENETIDGWSVSSISHECNISYRSDTDTPANEIEGNSSTPRMASVSSLNSSNSSSSVNSTNASTTPTKLMTSELDHKVMLIAKSYYGREAHQGIQRLSEGKYRIANRIVFVRLLKARHVMVRVGGGWTTLSHFLERHGGDPNQEISAADLLPMETRTVSVSARRRSYAPLVSTAQTTVSPNTPTFGRYISSTPVSRRSSLSSPEPWMSTSSGYSSSSAGCNGNSTSMMPTTRRRRRASEATTGRKPVLTHRASIAGIGSHTDSSLPTTPTPTPPRPTSEPIKSRYPNYLHSSQHITNKSNGITSSLMSTSPSLNLSKQNIFRKTVQKSC
ncbi:GAS2-like protein 3 [Oppia nitens]|uniref:GAS2-like protein 3 n=1 Tax=Oppia nitens TaxID=1686743 RepID=UPI0023DBB490|nr:GAS2-like protein 3 [Oppia nitens]